VVWAVLVFPLAGRLAASDLGGFRGGGMFLCEIKKKNSISTSSLSDHHRGETPVFSRAGVVGRGFKRWRPSRRVLDTGGDWAKGDAKSARTQKRADFFGVNIKGPDRRLRDGSNTNRPEGRSGQQTKKLQHSAKKSAENPCLLKFYLFVSKNPFFLLCRENPKIKNGVLFGSERGKSGVT